MQPLLPTADAPLAATPLAGTQLVPIDPDSAATPLDTEATHDVPEPFYSLMQEWSEEGHLYLHDEQPEAMSRLETYLETQAQYYDLVYRRTDWAPFMQADVGDVVVNNRCSSWSQENSYLNDMYDQMPSVLLILKNQILPGVSMEGISSWTIEQEILISAGAFKVVSKHLDPDYGTTLELEYLGK